MCYCDEFEFTINRADQFMIRDKSGDKWICIAPPDLWKLVEIGREKGIIADTWIDGNYSQVEIVDG